MRYPGEIRDKYSSELALVENEKLLKSYWSRLQDGIIVKTVTNKNKDENRRGYGLERRANAERQTKRVQRVE